jgi:hypothetical protein
MNSDDTESDEYLAGTGSPPETHYEVINPETGEIRFIKDDPFYHTLKQALMTAGVDIDAVKTEAELNDLLHPARYGNHVVMFLHARHAALAKKSVVHAALHASEIGNYAEAERLMAILRRRRELGLRVVPGKNREGSE